MAIHTLPFFGRTTGRTVITTVFFIGMGFAAHSPRSAIESMKLIN